MMDIISDDRQWKSRAVAAELLAQAIEVLTSRGIDEHNAISALEDALETRRSAYNMQVARD